MRLVPIGAAAVLFGGWWFATNGSAQVVPPEPHRHPGNFAAIEQLVTEINSAEKSEQINKMRNFGYIMARLKWSQSRPVKICFIDPAVSNETSSPKTIERIITLAMKWVQPSYANLTLDFGPPSARRRCSSADNGDIRIGFDPKSPYGPNWSVVGNDSSIPPDKPTANFYFEPDSGLAYYFPYTILHEFGHALGLIHEHQGGNCEGEFDFTLLYQYYGWTKEQIDANFRHLTNPGIVQLTPYCKGSIMNYVVDKAYYYQKTASVCYTPPISQLAECDQKTASVAYPPVVAAQSQAASQVYSIVEASTDDTLPNEQKKLLLAGAADVAQKAGLPDQLVDLIKRTAEDPTSFTDSTIRDLRLTLSNISKITVGGAASGPAAPNILMPAPSPAEKKLIVNIFKSLPAGQ